MRYVLRHWNCSDCGRSNKTMVGLDRSVKCEYCARVMKVQPVGTRAGEIGGQVSRSGGRV